MKSFDIEHTGVLVEDPLAMAEWYQRVLGFQVTFSGGGGDMAVAFLTDAAGRAMFEFACLPGIRPLKEELSHPLQLHLALRSDDPDSDLAYLVKQGAEFVEECPLKRPGDRLLLLRDPWGNSLQLVQRADAIDG